MKKCLCAVLALLVVASLLPSSANSSFDSQTQSDDSLKLSADLVVLDAHVVSKKSGLVVRGFARDDFVVHEDGVKQYISHFSQDKLPLSVVLLLDVSSSIAGIFDRLSAAAAQALKGLKPGDEAALMAFGGSTKIVQGLTKDRQLVAGAIQLADGTALENGTNINEAVYQAAVYLERTAHPQSRRAILAITDDVADTRRIPSPRSEDSAFARLYQSGAAVCGLLTFNPLRNARRFVTPGSIRTYAEETGGLVVGADKKKLEANLTEIIEHLRSRYSLGYLSSSQKRDGKFRQIKVQISQEAQKREGGTKVITRRGYYAHGGKT
ncbi:MAG TPA: VWA domain-containing protein [Blastocatellia bacterium]|nr:VWA domain-containing protein [Blastocatellia bacterium]